MQILRRSDIVKSGETNRNYDHELKLVLPQ